jgi:6-phosphofructokinase 1
MPRRIGILTGGGDAPGLNAVIRAVAKSLLPRGVRVLGIADGFEGFLRRDARELSVDDVSGILPRGGTILGTANRGDAPGRLREAFAAYRRWKLDGLVAVGGDGTHRLAHEFSKLGARVVGVPKTIDNDVEATEITFGFDSAVAVAAQALDALHSTADAHGRILVLEVMGRHAGWIALYAGVAGGADVILMPELGFDLDRVAEYVRRRHRRRRFTLVTVAEGAARGDDVARGLQDRTGIDARSIVLGHLQRAGSPTPFDRVLATQFGGTAAELAMAGKFGRMVALRGGRVTTVPIARVAGKLRLVPPNHPLVRTARAVGTCLGD